MENDKLQVFVATYDRPRLLARQLDSILSQTCPPREVTVLDNGSNPKTREVVLSRAERGARHCSTGDLGLLGNMLTAQRLAKDGCHVAVFHDDDVLDPHYFAFVSKLLNRHPDLALVVGESVQLPVDEIRFCPEPPSGRGLLLDSRAWASFLFDCSARRYPFAFYRSDVFRTLDIPDLHRRCGRACDIAILLRAGACGRTGFLAHPFAVYCCHPGQDSYDPNTFPDVRCFANLYAEYHRQLGDDLRNLGAFSYSFQFMRKLRSSYKRRGKRTLSYPDFLAYAREVGAYPSSGRWVRVLSNHLTQKLVESLVKKSFRRTERTIC